MDSIIKRQEEELNNYVSHPGDIVTGWVISLPDAQTLLRRFQAELLEYAAEVCEKAVKPSLEYGEADEIDISIREGANAAYKAISSHFHQAAEGLTNE